MGAGESRKTKTKSRTFEEARGGKKEACSNQSYSAKAFLPTKKIMIYKPSTLQA